MDLGAILNCDSHHHSHASNLRIDTHTATAASQLRFRNAPPRGSPVLSKNPTDFHDSFWMLSTVASRDIGSGSQSVAYCHSKCSRDLDRFDSAALQSQSLSDNHRILSPPSQSLATDALRDKFGRQTSRASTPLSPPSRRPSYPVIPQRSLFSSSPVGFRPSRQDSIASFELGTGWVCEIPRQSSKEPSPDDVSATSEEGCGSETENESLKTPDTPDTEHIGDSDKMSRAAKSRCSFDNSCELLSPDRKVTSHYFGRNKKETRAIPEDCWVLYCRQHYQRVRYRSKDADFAKIQMDLVKSTVINLERWGGVQDFSISLRKRAMDRIKAEDENARAIREAKEHKCEPPDPVDPSDRCRERWLLQFTGPNVSFRGVYDFIDMVVAYCQSQGCQALEFEVVPNIKENAKAGGNSGSGGNVTGAGGSAGSGSANTGRKRESVRRTLNGKHGGSSRVTKPSKSGTASTGCQVRTKILTTRPAKKS